MGVDDCPGPAAPDAAARGQQHRGSQPSQQRRRLTQPPISAVSWPAPPPSPACQGRAGVTVSAAARSATSRLVGSGRRRDGRHDDGAQDQRAGVLQLVERVLDGREPARAELDDDQRGTRPNERAPARPCPAHVGRLDDDAVALLDQSVDERGDPLDGHPVEDVPRSRPGTTTRSLGRPATGWASSSRVRSSSSAALRPGLSFSPNMIATLESGSALTRTTSLPARAIDRPRLPATNEVPWPAWRGGDDAPSRPGPASRSPGAAGAGRTPHCRCAR